MRVLPIGVRLWMAWLVVRLAPVTAFCEPSIMDSKEAAALLTGYFEAMSVPKPFHLLEGVALQSHHRQLRERILADVGLAPLPERIDLDVHRSKPITHPWCTIEMIEYQLWPGIYSQALLLVPKEFQEKPAPAVLCPHGHWDHHFAHPDVQKRLLVLAKMGYVVLSPRQNHHENLLLGFSNQTLMIWTNMRGIDLLQSLPEVDPARIGVAGASGGGLQTQMLAALDDRIKAVTIVGMTCDFREILFPHAAHCGCNHWPRAMAYTDGPEISALAFPSPVQYLAMNDWTRHFPHDNFPKIQELYRLNGLSERVSCTYWPTGHTYDRQKRERTYWWMERWLRNHGCHHTPIPVEPEEVVTVFPPQLLDEWPVPNPGNKGLEALTAHIHAARHFTQNEIPDPTDPIRYKMRMRQLLPEILGLGNGLAPRFDEVQVVDARKQDGVMLSRVRFPSEGNLQVPALIVAPAVQDSESGPVTLILDKRGMSGIETLEPFLERAARGEVIIFPDIRFSGVYHLESLAGIIGPDMVRYNVASNFSAYTRPEERHQYLLWAWERNSVVWGRPLVTMAVADIRGILNTLQQVSRPKMDSVRIQTRGSAHLALAAVFAAILDERITALDIDLCHARYDAYRYWYETPDELPVIPLLLRYGDVPQWLGVISDRNVVVRHLEASTDEIHWLRRLFAADANAKGLCIE